MFYVMRLMLFALAILLVPLPALADDVELKRQSEMIEAQRRLIEELQNRVEKLEKSLKGTGQTQGSRRQEAVEPAPIAGSKQDAGEMEVLKPKQHAAPGQEAEATDKVASSQQGDAGKSGDLFAGDVQDGDAIGDILSDAVYRGEFPGSILIPGPKGKISFRLGGYVKTITYYDNNEVGSGNNFLPATITGDSDEETSFTAAFTRINLDARAPSEWGTVRGFTEIDFQNSGGDSPRLRHAYGELDGRFLAGKYWSGFMDLSAIPDSLSEATVSGAIFARQLQFRWTENISEQTRLTFGIEEPDNDDFTTTDPSDEGKEVWPDLVMSARHQFDNRMHLKLGGILRRLEFEGAGNRDDSDFGWGFQLSSRINTWGRDSFILSGAYGEGLGRYLLGTRNSAAAITTDGSLRVLENYGGYASYRHFWNDRWWSNLTYGYARVGNSSALPDSAVHATQWAGINLMWTPVTNFGIGLEYLYGWREDKAGDEDTAQRIRFGVQFF